ncbi:hypothetical protein SAMN05216330_104470 [Bradyrhizobium sp. Ghvi]|uniref:hypothetical protein n=1 Tax=Bradyrhizobium sp. Ghvi TaxID=1855319 RepID=UPI0008F224B9|nr:hypothetical protein [Bradyrhizobium sp. Ghvi]SFO74595.1 hypothetical protein SAMN05216330_104470 [Bradyrhizobium sp. Ghvi]
MTDDKTYEPLALPDQFAETLVRIDSLGPCRRLVFAVRDPSAGEGMRAVTAKLVLSTEAMIEIGRMMQSGELTAAPLATFTHNSILPN